jgi:hypothetical protein
MPITSAIVLDGLLKSDGTLELARHPALPPGPVRVTLEPVLEASADGVCESSMLDSWVELPLPENGKRLYPKLGELPLPDPPVIVGDVGAA